MMYIVFFSTSNVFKAEDLLNKADVVCHVVPTPASDRAYCGVCLKVDRNARLDVISNIAYDKILEG